jgi:hypothetical protein
MFDAYVRPGLIIASVIELIWHGLVNLDTGYRLVAARQWDSKLSYLKPVYDKIMSFKKPPRAEKVAANLTLAQQDPLRELVPVIGSSLVSRGYASESDVKFLSKSWTKYMPRPEAVARVIGSVRAEFLGSGPISDQNACLVRLMEEYGSAGDYFSKAEVSLIRQRLAQLRADPARTSTKAMLDYMDGIFTAHSGTRD